MSNNSQKLVIEDLKIDDLEISTFVNSMIEENSESVSKVMAASCTTCTCCCS